MLYHILIPVILFALGFLLGRLTKLAGFLKPSAETSAAWQRRGNGE